jgi:hypothetical protein
MLLSIGAVVAQKNVHARTVICAFSFHAPLAFDVILKYFFFNYKIIMFSNLLGIRVFEHISLKTALNIPMSLKQIRIWHEN